MVDEEGVATTYSHYAGSTIVKSELREAVAAQGGFDAQPEILTTYTGTFTLNKKQVPEWRVRLTTTTAGGLTLTESHTFDEEARIVSHTDTNSLTTTKVWSQNDKLITETFPDLSTRITTLDSDGRTLSVTGTGVVAKFYHYQTLTNGGTRTTVFTGVDNGPRFETTEVDATGRITQEIKPSFDGQVNAIAGYQYSTSYPEVPILLTRSGQATSVSALNTVGSSFRRGVTADNATLSLDSQTDRVTDEVVTDEQDGGGLWRVTRTTVYPVAGAGTAKLVRTTRKKLAGFNGIEIARSEEIDIASNATVTMTALSGALRNRSITRPAVTGTETSTSIAGRLMTLAIPGVAGSLTYGYDALGRETSRKDPRQAQTSGTAYVTGKSQIASKTDAAGNTTNHTYHPQGAPGAGCLRSITLADTTVAWATYTLRGELMASWGSQTNPTWRRYNIYGQLESLHTWKTAPTLDADAMPTTVPANSATTTWLYDPATGLLSGKRDADAKGADYRYDVARRLTERKWARGGSTRVTTTYGYNNGFDQLGSVTYNNGTPNASFTYDRLGRPYSAGNGVAGSIFAYDPTTLYCATPKPFRMTLTATAPATSLASLIAAKKLRETQIIRQFA